TQPQVAKHERAFVEVIAGYRIAHTPAPFEISAKLSRPEVVGRVAAVPHHLCVTVLAAVGTVDVPALLGQAGQWSGVNHVGWRQIGGLFTANLQLGGENHAEPGESAGEKGAEENERAVIHRFAPATAGCPVAFGRQVN